MLNNKATDSFRTHFSTKQVRVGALKERQTPSNLPFSQLMVPSELIVHLSGQYVVSRTHGCMHTLMHGLNQNPSTLLPPSLPPRPLPPAPFGGVSWEEPSVAPVAPRCCGGEPCTGCWSLSQQFSQRRRGETPKKTGEVGVVVSCGWEDPESLRELSNL